ncbi:MAG: M60 family metallopeptidase, partial [Verrucomicrobiota bacterium]
ISSGLSGLITIRVPREANYDSIEVTIEGAVKAPLYVHGETDIGLWREQIRHYPAPWAELASSRMILALPSEQIRSLSNPDAVMELWDEIIDCAAELAPVSRDNYRAERLVFDRQTAAGLMHSSYPVAAHIGSASALAVDSQGLRENGNWGFFHEYGHNHQHNLWALPGTGETTCNLWSVYIYEELIGKDRDETHNAIRPLNRRQRLNDYFASGAQFDSKWSVWVALETYLMVQEAFGWEPFKTTFHEYNLLPKEEWPQGQQEKNDQWVIRLSRACGKNLAPFWSTWNLPLSDSVAEQLSDLPVWEDHPVARYE